VAQGNEDPAYQSIAGSRQKDRAQVPRHGQVIRVTQGGALLDEQELAGKLQGIATMHGTAYETPAFDLVARHKR